MKTLKLSLSILILLGLFVACEEDKKDDPDPELGKTSFFMREATSDSLRANHFYYLSVNIKEETYLNLNTAFWPTSDFHTYAPSCKDESAMRIWREREGENDTIPSTIEIEVLDTLGNEHLIFEGKIDMIVNRCRAYRLIWDKEADTLKVQLAKDSYEF